MQWLASAPQGEVAHFSSDASGVEAPAVAHAFSCGDFGEHRFEPARQALRGSGRSLRHLALDHAHGVHEAQSVRVQAPRPCRLRHQLPDREVRQL